MELGRPFATVTPTLDGDALVVLATHEVAVTTGQIRRVLNGFSEEGIRKVLSRLVAQGVVVAERMGHAYAYRLNTRATVGHTQPRRSCNGTETTSSPCPSCADSATPRFEQPMNGVVRAAKRRRKW